MILRILGFQIAPRRTIHHPWHQIAPRYHKVSGFSLPLPSPWSLRQSYVAYWARFWEPTRIVWKSVWGKRFLVKMIFPGKLSAGTWKWHDFSKEDHLNQSFWLALRREWGNESPEYPCIASFPRSLLRATQSFFGFKVQNVNVHWS